MFNRIVSSFPPYYVGVFPFRIFVFALWFVDGESIKINTYVILPVCIFFFFFFWLLLDLSCFSLAVRKYLDVSGEAGGHFALILPLVTAELRFSDDVNLKVSILCFQKMGFSNLQSGISFSSFTYL